MPATLLPDPLHVVADLVAPEPATLAACAVKDAADHRAATALGPAEVAVARAKIDAHLREFLLRQRAEYLSHPVFALLYDDLAEFVCRPGKRLRPMILLLAHRILGGPAQTPSTRMDEGLWSVAASLELLHGFILIHDDIIDRAETRRGLPTLHRVLESRLSSFSDRVRAGRNLALVMGDILFALAQKCLLESPLPPETTTRLCSLMLGCMVETGFGEAADIIHATRDVAKVDLLEIEQMYSLKTTRYTIECPLVMGGHPTRRRFGGRGGIEWRGATGRTGVPDSE